MHYTANENKTLLFSNVFFFFFFFTAMKRKENKEKRRHQRSGKVFLEGLVHYIFS